MTSNSTPLLLPLTIIIVTHRKDDRFEASLASTQFAQEVIIFDNNSGADWQKLKQIHHFRVIDSPEPINDFSMIRNKAAKEAQYNWVFFLDSDEVITSDAPADISRVIADNLYEGVLVHRRDVFHGKELQYGEAGTTFLIRLARKRQLRYVGVVHEVPHIPGSIGQSNIEIVHYAHNNISEFFSDVSVYARLVAQEKTTTFYQNLIELFLFPPAKFLWNFFGKLGFLDGWRGLTYAIIMSFHSFFVRLYRYEILQSEYKATT